MRMGSLLLLAVGLLLAPKHVKAQAPVLTLGASSGTAIANKPITFGVALSGSAGSNISALEFNLPFPNSSLIGTIGAAGTAATKQLTCNADTTTCIVYGLNSTAIADGIIASFTWTPLVTGSFTYNLSNITAASSAGAAVTTTTGSTVALTITNSPCDINNDGKIDITDIQSYITTYVFTTTTPPASPIGSGIPIVDIQRIAIASATGTCTTGK